MKVGDLVMSRESGRTVKPGSIGLVMEAEDDQTGVHGHWVEYFEYPEDWTWYSFNERNGVEVISEAR